MSKIRVHLSGTSSQTLDIENSDMASRLCCQQNSTRSSAIAEGPRDASCQLKSCQLPCNSAETTYMTSSDQIDGYEVGDLVRGNA